MQYFYTHNIQKFQKYSIGFLGILFLCSCLFFSTPTHAVNQKSYGTEDTALEARLFRYKGESIQTRIGKIIGAALSLTGIIFFILAVYAGFLWMTARGDETQAKKARDTIIMAVTGLVIILGAYAITDFVFSSIEPPKKTSAQTNLGPGDFIPQDSNQMAA